MARREDGDAEWVQLLLAVYWELSETVTARILAYHCGPGSTDLCSECDSLMTLRNALDAYLGEDIGGEEPREEE